MYVEAAAALAQARRMGRLDDGQHNGALGLLDSLWAEVDVIDIDQDLAVDAARAADTYALGGYATVHCAAAERVSDPDLVAASGDRRLLAAWREVGIAGYDVNAQA